MNVKYIGPAKDYSGYGEANRHDIAALIEAGIGVTAKIPHYTMESSDYGIIGEKIASIENAPLDYGAIILHTTPNVYQSYMEPGKYHIARVFWETDKLPEDFARNVELCDEVWTGSEYNAAAIRKSGVTKPIHIIPEAIDTALAIDSLQAYNVFYKDTFKFYSIFEWTERKNPAALVMAYYLEFQNETDVSLTLKTYVDNFTRPKKDEIDTHLQIIKQKLKLPKYPPVYLYRNLMDRTQMYRFHKTFDCYVSTHRGEGWGIPQMEALLLNKPVITTNCGGIHEYLRNGESAILLPYTLIPLRENSRNMQWYTNEQQWADVSIDEIRSALRAVYQNKQKAFEMGMNGGKVVRDLFSLPVVGGMMKKRLDIIAEGKR